MVAQRDQGRDEAAGQRQARAGTAGRRGLAPAPRRGRAGPGRRGALPRLGSEAPWVGGRAGSGSGIARDHRADGGARRLLRRHGALGRGGHALSVPARQGRMASAGPTRSRDTSPRGRRVRPRWSIPGDSAGPIRTGAGSSRSRARSSTSCTSARSRPRGPGPPPGSNSPTSRTWGSLPWRSCPSPSCPATSAGAMTGSTCSPRSTATARPTTSAGSWTAPTPSGSP